VNNTTFFFRTGDSAKYGPPYTELPASDPQAGKVGSIELKASFRKLGPGDDASRYYTAPVRYYQQKQSAIAYRDSNDPLVAETWGLTSLHIIQKTPNAPTFVFATFGHINNIRDDQGNPVEDPDGGVIAKAGEPFIPNLTIIPDTA